MVFLLWTAQAGADPVFVDRSDSLPGAHTYTGDWKHFVGGGVAVLDCNGDRLPDILAAGGTSPARLFINMTVAPAAPLRFRAGALRDLTGVTGAYPLDIDGDDVLDLAVLRVGPNVLLKGDGACGFRDATALWGLESGDAWTTAFSATWEDDDDFPTLAFGNYVDRADPDGPFGACDDNVLYRPHGTGYGAAIPLAPGHCALSMLFSDWLRNGAAELRVSNDRHYYLRGGQEQMWRLSPLGLRTEADGWDTVSIWGMGIASADIDGDSYPEVMLTSMGDQLLMLNEGGVLRRAPFSIGTYAQRPHIGDDGRPSTGWHAEFGDIDNDGRLDLFIAKGNVDQMPSNAMEDPNNLLIQRRDGTFAERADAAGIATTARSRGAALVDFDGDGKLDVLVSNRRAPLELWQNRTLGTGNWLTLDLRQATGNRRAIGAWVTLSAGDWSQTREVTVGGGHAGGQSGPLHFGLGTRDSVNLRIEWPDGRVTNITDLPVNRALVLRP